jgi:hypothetical protein
MRTLILTSGFLAIVLATPAAAQAPGKAFCLRGDNAALNCIYDTMAQCEEARKGQTTHSCIANPKM